MKGNIKMANLSEDSYRSAVTTSVLRLSNDLIPQRTEVALEVGKRVVDIESGEYTQDVRIPRWDLRMQQVAGDVEQDDE